MRVLAIIAMATWLSGCLSTKGAGSTMKEATSLDGAFASGSDDHEPTQKKPTPAAASSVEQQLDDPSIPESSLASQSPTVDAIDALWTSLLRYAKNVASTGQIYQASLSDKDEQLIDYLIAQDPGARTSKENAILFLALMEHAVVEYEYQRDAELEKAGSPQKKEKGSSAVLVLKPEEVLMFLATEYNIQLMREIQKNRYLEDPSIYHMTFIIMHYVKAPTALRVSFSTYVGDMAKSWSRLYDTLVEYEDSDDFTVSSEGSAQESIGQALQDLGDKQARPKRYSAGEFAEGDRILREARLLHSKKLYKEAIEQLEEIEDSSPHFGEAKLLAIRYSDDAVNQLRKEAAQLYQAQLKVLSIQTKIEYLQDSEKKLVQALTDYPDSKWTSKVRGNLAVIQKRLDELSLQTGGSQ